MIDKYIQEVKTNQIIKESVIIYNELRSHYSNYMLPPNQMHSQNIINMRTYKAKTVAKKFLLLFLYLILSNNLYRFFRTGHKPGNYLFLLYL